MTSLILKAADVVRLSLPPSLSHLPSHGRIYKSLPRRSRHNTASNGHQHLASRSLPRTTTNRSKLIN
ncbi:hypothetical protein E2C01_040584 [Portunus trituberculatus]|uniref:Uncharacterized protein n=1 Tax=Portunus trituberculatus TaxID=210409 RepID=A0A5B7FR65_PORTR|nr:hypothetical protein [Portunus trituberculatus]